MLAFLRSLKWQWGLVPLPSFFFWLPELLADRGIVFRDTVTFVYVLRRWHWRHVLADGFIPLWNDGIFSGLDHVADPQIGLYSPLSWIYFIWEGAAANQVYLLLLMAAGAVGMALYLRVILKDEAVALAFGAFYPLTGIVLSTVSASPFMAGICLFPWVLWAHQRLIKQPSPWRFAALVIFLAWPILEGDPFGSFWMSGFLMASALFSKNRTRNVLKLIGIGLLAATLTAPAWLPAFDTLGQSTRAEGVSYKDASYFSFTPGQVLQSMVPAMWGRFDEGCFWGHAWVHEDIPYSKRFWQDSIYSGIPFLCLLLFGAWLSLKGGKHRLLLLFGVVYLGISFGDNFILHPLFHKTLPFYSNLRFPGKFLSYAHLFFYPLAAFALADLRERSRISSRAVLGMGLLVAGVFAVSSGLSFWIRPLSAEISAGGLSVAEQMMSRGATTALAMSGAALLLVVFGYVKKNANRGKVLVWGLFALGVLDLLVWVPKLPTSPNQELDSPSVIGRALTGPSGFQRMLRNQRIDGTAPWVNQQGSRQSLLPNWGLLDGVNDILGYAPTLPGRFKKLSGTLLFKDLPTWTRTMGITHILTTYSPSSKSMVRLLDQGRLQLVEVFESLNLVVLAVQPAPGPFEVFGDCLGVDGSEAAMRAIVRLGPERKQVILETEDLLLEGRRTDDKGPFQLACSEEAVNPPRIKVQEQSRTTRGRSYAVQAQTKGFLLIRDNFHPGWKAFIDGKPAHIARADFVSMAIALKPGEHILELQFDPLGYTIGNWLSLSTMGLGLFALLFLLWRRKVQGPGEGA